MALGLGLKGGGASQQACECSAASWQSLEVVHLVSLACRLAKAKASFSRLQRQAAHDVHRRLHWHQALLRPLDMPEDLARGAGGPLAEGHLGNNGSRRSAQRQKYKSHTYGNINIDQRGSDVGPCGTFAPMLNMVHSVALSETTKATLWVVAHVNFLGFASSWETLG